jgi:hypothetical protein
MLQVSARIENSDPDEEHRAENEYGEHVRIIGRRPTNPECPLGRQGGLEAALTRPGRDHVGCGRLVLMSD